MFPNLPDRAICHYSFGTFAFWPKRDWVAFIILRRTADVSDAGLQPIGQAILTPTRRSNISQPATEGQEGLWRTSGSPNQDAIAMGGADATFNFGFGL